MSYSTRTTEEPLSTPAGGATSNHSLCHPSLRCVCAGKVRPWILGMFRNARGGGRDTLLPTAGGGRNGGAGLYGSMRSQHRAGVSKSFLATVAWAMVSSLSRGFTFLVWINLFNLTRVPCVMWCNLQASLGQSCYSVFVLSGNTSNNVGTSVIAQGQPETAELETTYEIPESICGGGCGVAAQRAAGRCFH